MTASFSNSAAAGSLPANTSHSIAQFLAARTRAADHAKKQADKSRPAHPEGKSITTTAQMSAQQSVLTTQAPSVALHKVVVMGGGGFMKLTYAQYPYAQQSHPFGAQIKGTTMPTPQQSPQTTSSSTVSPAQTQTRPGTTTNAHGARNVSNGNP